MPGVEFNEPQLARSQPIAAKQSAFTRAVISMGLAKDEKGANTVLLVVAGILFCVALAVFFMGSGGSEAPINEDEVLRG